MSGDITELNRRLVDRVQAVAERLLPNGVRHGREWCVGSIHGEAGQSLKLCLVGDKRGKWRDFQSGDGGDLIDLWTQTTGAKLVDALDEIRSFLGLEKPSFDKPERRYKRPVMPPQAAFPTDDVLAYLIDERRISEEAIALYQVKARGRKMLFPSYLPDGSMPFVKVRGLDPTADGKKDIRPIDSDLEPVLFGWQAIADDARTVTITEGEIDALTMWDYGYPALSVPFGGGKGAKQQWIVSEFERLQRFDTIYLALDMDEAGQQAVEEIASRLGRHRCRVVKLPFKDPNECRQNGVTQAEIATAIANAESLDPPELRRAGDFRDAIWRLFRPVDGVEPGYSLPFLKLGRDLLFRPGEVTIWTGATGDGKTQILSHASVSWGYQGARCCIASLEMAPPQLLARMATQAMNTDRPTDAFLTAAIDWLNEFVWIFDKIGKSPVERLIDVFEYARARYGCDVFVIDSLMRMGIASEDYRAQEDAVFRLVNWTVSNGIHLHLVAHSRKADKAHPGVPANEDVKGASEISSNAFNIVSVWRNRKHEDEMRLAREAADAGGSVGAERLAELEKKPGVVLNVAKQRNGNFEGKIGLWFNPSSRQYRSSADPREGRTYIAWPQQE